MTNSLLRDRVEPAEKLLRRCIGPFARRRKLSRYGRGGDCVNHHVRCRLAITFCVLLMVACPATSRAQNAKPVKLQKPENLLDPKKALSDGWKHKSAVKNSKLEDTWTIDNVNPAVPVLICKKGKPAGYLRTNKNYENFELTLEWMYHDANCNSGILIHTNGTDKIWPVSIQVQLHRPEAGSIFPQKGAKTTNRVLRKNQKLALKKWHTIKIRSENGTIAVWINGKKVGEVNGCVPSKGHIALQSEGSEIHFRKIQVTEIKPPAKKKDEKKKKVEPKKPKKKSEKVKSSAVTKSNAIPVFGSIQAARRKCIVFFDVRRRNSSPRFPNPAINGMEAALPDAIIESVGKLAERVPKCHASESCVPTRLKSVPDLRMGTARGRRVVVLRVFPPPCQVCEERRNAENVAGRFAGIRRTVFVSRRC
ncbi:MAG: DUF1080 domain-containing protein [Planctomycetes bacterium]|nr:DUF1080 domain-containing protein [Planctomycetota bacterium]